MFVVEATHPSSDGWEARDADLYHRAGRRWDFGSIGDGVRQVAWFCDTLSVAIELRNALRNVGGVSVVAREPIDER